MVHVLYQRCACSRRIIDHLVAGARPQDMAERVVLVDAAADTVNELVAAGFHVDQVSAEALHADWHIDAAPLLLVVDPAGTVRYAGGYTARKQGPVIADLDIVGRVRAGSAAESLPLFGCAVSRALQSSVDPLGLKRLLAWRPLSS